MNNPPDHLRPAYGGQEGGSHASAPASAPLLAMDDVRAGYADFQALFNITLHVDAGEIVTLLGANGAGKTTTLRAISGLIHPTNGTIRFEGKDISRLPPHEIVELGISHVPEGRQLFPHMSVDENLALGAYIGRARPRIEQTIEEQFTLFPRLRERRRQLAGTLSGGEQQMVAIARGLMAEPKLLMLDEPSLGLAPKIVEEVFAKIQEIGTRGLTVLIVEQNVVDSLSISRRGYVIENGAVDPGVGTSAKELLRNERLRAAYLGL
jgi:branched-chain amino acid transport system ATP-binding protein